MSKHLQFGIGAVVALTIALSIRSSAQTVDAPDPTLGTIVGTVMDVNGGTVPGATVVLQGAASDDHGQLVTGDNGFFEFRLIKPGVPYRVKVTASDFASGHRPLLPFNPGSTKFFRGFGFRS